VVRPEKALAFIAALPIERFYGVGPVTARKMKAAGIASGADLRARSEEELVHRFGKAGRHYFRIARGEDERPVSPARPHKSIGAERTFERDIADPAEMLLLLDPIAAKVAARMAAAGQFGCTVTLKIKHHDFTVITRQRTRQGELRTADDLMAAAERLLRTPEPPGRPVRLLGLTVSNFPEVAAAECQLTLGL
jgi:DNA polymerase IV